MFESSIVLQYAAGGKADTLRLERSAFGHGGANPSRRTNFKVC